MGAWGKGPNQNKGPMSLMAKKQECHWNTTVETANTAAQILPPRIFFLFISQRSSRASLLKGNNNAKNFFCYCLRLPFLGQGFFYYPEPLKKIEDVLSTI